MNHTTLFFITAEFPYGTGETFIENEISFLAKSFDQIIIVPLTKSSKEHRPVPPNVLIEPFQTARVHWQKVFRTIFNEPEVRQEFLRNAASNPLKNKILLKSVQRGLDISTHLKESAKRHQSRTKFYYSYWLDDGAIGIALLDCGGVKVSRAHRWDIYTENHLYHYLPLRRFLTQRLSQIACISQDGKMYLEKRAGQPNKISLSRLGVINRQSFSRREFSGQDLNVISISYLIPRKRVELIGESIAHINSQHIHWDHFGDGPLLDRVKRLFPFGNFHGHIGNDRLTEVLSDLSSNSLLINTSTSEGIPVSMMEAMSFGIPCIGTNVGGVSEIIKDNYNGFLMPADPSPQVVSEYINRYFNSTAKEKECFRLNAYETWRENFDAEKNYKAFAAELKALYRQCR